MFQHIEETILLKNILFRSDPNLSNQMILYIKNITAIDNKMLEKTRYKFWMQFEKFFFLEIKC
jgi:hypothetical protein